jgi:hypothetical protein
MKVLVACEFSGVVRDAFIAKGHDAWSCDLIPSDNTGPHLQTDVLDQLEKGWDLMIAFPPCKYICNGGNNWLNRRPDLDWRKNRQQGALFFMELINAPIKKIAIENPIGCMSTLYRKPDQIIRPFMFGHPYNKDICLWLKGLPKLIPTNVIPGPYKHLDFWSTERHKDGRDVKAITFQGIAEAMAEQWGNPKQQEQHP